MKPTQLELAMIAANVREGSPAEKVAAAFELWTESGKALTAEAQVEVVEKRAAGTLTEKEIKKQVDLFAREFPNGAEEPDEKLLEMLMPSVPRPRTRDKYWTIYGIYGEISHDSIFPMDTDKFVTVLRDFHERKAKNSDGWKLLLARVAGKNGSETKKQRALKKSA